MLSYSLQRSSIALTVTLKNEGTFRLTTGITTDPSGKNWNKKKGLLKGDDVDEKNDFLLDFKAKIEKLILDAKKSSKAITKLDVQNYARVLTNLPELKEEDQNVTFLTYYDIDLKDSSLSLGTVKAKRITRNNLSTYLETLGITDIYFEQIDVAFLNKFETYLRKKGFSLKYVDKHKKDLKTVLKKAYEEGVSSSRIFEKIKRESRKKMLDDGIHIYLSEEEIDQIYRLTFKLAGNDLKIMDLFLFMCWTGLPYSDSQKIDKFNFSKQKQGLILKYRRTKTGQLCEVPIVFKKCMEIIERNNFEFIRISEQNLNEGIKRILNKEKLFQNKIKVDTSYMQETVTKCSLISSHIGRKSWATNAFLKGWNLNYCIAVTGHSTIKQFLEYVKAEQFEKAAGLWQYKDY